VRFGPAVLLAVFASGCAPHRVAPLESAAAPRCHDLRAPDGATAGVALAWRRPSEDGRDGRRAPPAWCAAVGPAVAVPDRPASSQPGAGIDAIAVVTWNVHVGGGDVVGFVQALRAGRLTNGTPVPDVVLLVQEAFRSSRDVPDRVPPGPGVPGVIRAQPPQGPRLDIVRAAALLEMTLFYVPSMRNGADVGAGGEPEDRGNAVLATRPLTDLAAIELPFERQRKVAIAATVSGVTTAGTRWTVRVVSAHLDASAGARHLWMFSSGQRAAQARALADALGGERSVALGGDLNTWADGPFERAPLLLARAFNDTPPVKLQPTFGWLLLDYLFFRLPDTWRAESRRVDDSFGSDHRPVLGWIHFKAERRSQNLERSTELRTF
jgi:endonuclease/exonuclease/phosphatase family metal-dependent hydrolase